jgi:hypothetical protein
VCARNGGRSTEIRAHPDRALNVFVEAVELMTCIQEVPASSLIRSGGGGGIGPSSTPM